MKMYRATFKLEDYGSVEVEMRNREMRVKYVMDREVVWTSVGRRREKSARSEDSENGGNFNVNNGRKKLGDVQKGGWDPGNIYAWKISVKMGDSETQPYCLEN